MGYTEPMDTLKLTFAETGPIPNNQCALKDALLLAMSSGATAPNVQEILANASLMFQFLENPTGGQAPAQQAPAQQPSGAAKAAASQGPPTASAG